MSGGARGGRVPRRGGAEGSTGRTGRASHPARGGHPGRASRQQPSEAATGLPLTHPALLAAALAAAASILFSVTFRLIDSDFWQHLLVGRAIWERAAIPREHLWSWLSYGREEVLPSWLFRAALWPFYAAGEVEGLFVWRWATTLLVFGFLWATARRMGARGLVPLVVLAWCALIYRGRSQVRPETLAAVLMAIEIWLLESRRHGGKVSLLWLVPLMWVWANAHISYFIGFVLLGLHAGRAWLGSRRAAPAGRERLGPYAVAGLLMLGAAFLNPFGWEGLWQPLDYALNLSREPLFQGIGELQPFSLAANLRNGAWLMIPLWPLLVLWRAWGRGWDGIEVLTCVLATAYALPSQRFMGVYAVAAAPFLARDLEEWVRARRWPRWTSAPAARAALAGAACLVIGIPEWRRPSLRPGLGVALERFPVAACDFMKRREVRGRGFQHFRFAGYQLWRFWPARERLPFMDIHQSGTPQDRAALFSILTAPGTWPEVSGRLGFDYAVLDRRQASGAPLLDVLDADTAWAPVFVDDTAALYALRSGPLAALADSFGYRLLGGGAARLSAVAARAAADSAFRRSLRLELERAAGESRWNATAHGLLANLAVAEERFADARRHLEAVLAADPLLPGAHQRLGIVALWEERPRDAVALFERERRLHGARPGIELGIGMAHEQAGDKERARRAYQRELALDPASSSARVRLEGLGAGARDTTP
jgi:tetratricopeptide (TPR) repeat protein